MLQAMNTGHEGSLTTIHANTPRDAVSRLETMISMGGIELPIRALRNQFASAVDLIIQANRLQGGPRKITDITEVVGMEGDTIVMQKIFEFVQDGIGEDGKAFGHFESTGVRPAFIGEARGRRRPTAAQPVRRPELGLTDPPPRCRRDSPMSPGVTPADSPVRPLPTPAVMAETLLIPLFAAGFIALVGLGCFAVWTRTRPTGTEDRLTALVGGKRAAPALKTSELLAEGAAGVGGVAGRLSGSLGKLGLLLEQADNPMTPHTFFLACGASAAAGFAAAVLGGAPAPAVPGGGAGRRAGAAGVRHAGPPVPAQGVRQADAGRAGADRPGPAQRAQPRQRAERGGRGDARAGQQGVQLGLRRAEPRHPAGGRAEKHAEADAEHGPEVLRHRRRHPAERRRRHGGDSGQAEPPDPRAVSRFSARCRR